MISEQAVKDFADTWLAEYGEVLPLETAQLQAESFLRLIKLVLSIDTLQITRKDLTN